jgi:drug/metabolite transporter (DMT)-like permease
MAAVVIIWGFAGTVEVLSLRGLTPFQFSAWSTVAGALGVLGYLALRGKATSLAAFGLRDHVRLCIVSLLGFGIYYSVKYIAYSISPVAPASVLQSTYMIFIALFAIPVLGQSAGWGKLLGILTGFAGVALIISGGTFSSFSPEYLPGFGCALAAGISFGLFSVLSEKYAFDRVSALFYYHAYSAAALMLLLFFRGEFVLPAGMGEIAGILYNGPTANGIGIFLWLTAQNSTDDVSVLTGMLYFVPFISLLCFAVFLHIPIPLYALQGLLLIVGGMAIHTFRSRKFRKKRSVALTE